MYMEQRKCIFSFTLIMATPLNSQSLETCTVPQLRQILRDRKIPCNNYKKAKLLQLASEAIVLYEPLEEDDKEQSIKQRTTVNGVTLPKPDSTFIPVTDDLKDLPSVSLTDLLIYLRVVCKWGDDRLRNYKKDDGHKMFIDGHITEVKLGLMERHPTHIYVKGKCVPEQSQSADSYKLWILVKKDIGYIESAGCACVASDDGTCKHIVALLFSIVDFGMRHSDRHTLVGTDVQCTWNQPRRESKPSLITDLDFRHQTQTPMVEPSPLQYVPLQHREPKDDIDTKIFSLLKDHAPNAVLLGVMQVPDDFTEDKAASLIDIAAQFKKKYVLDEITDMPTFLQYLTSNFSKNDLEEISSYPQGSDDWIEQRRGRITGSLMGTVWRFQMSNQPNNSLVKDVFNIGKNLSGLPAIEYGNEFEPVARTLYFEEKIKENHKGLVIRETGLIIDESMPIIGASPDGLVRCKCCGDSVLEIKCCFSRQNELPHDIAESGTYHVYIDSDNKYQLKKNSSWYHQIIAEMAITRCEMGDFVLFTNKGIIHFPVPFSEDHWINLKTKCRNVFEKFILPKL